MTSIQSICSSAYSQYQYPIALRELKRDCVYMCLVLLKVFIKRDKTLYTCRLLQSLRISYITTTSTAMCVWKCV